MSEEMLILERIAVLTARVEAVATGQESIRKAIESGTDGLQVRVRLLEDYRDQAREDAQAIKEQQSALRVQLIVGILMALVGAGLGAIL